MTIFPFCYVDVSLQSRHFEARRGLRGQTRPGRDQSIHQSLDLLKGNFGPCHLVRILLQEKQVQCFIAALRHFWFLGPLGRHVQCCPTYGPCRYFIHSWARKRRMLWRCTLRRRRFLHLSVFCELLPDGAIWSRRSWLRIHGFDIALVALSCLKNGCYFHRRVNKMLFLD